MTKMQSRMEVSEKTNTELRAEIALLRNVGTVFGSPEASKVNTRRGAQFASIDSFESANTIPSPAANNAEQAPPAASVARTTTSAAETSRARTSTPKCAYAAVVTSGKPGKGEKLKVGAQPAQPSVRGSLPRTSRVDEEGFTKVERKRRKPSTRNLCGTAPSGPNMLLRPAVPTTQLYVSRLHYTTTVEEVVQYMKVKTNWTLRVERLESRHDINFKSFVVRVPTHHLQTCLKEDFWPKGVVYRRFRGRLRDTAQRHTTPTTLRV